MKDDLISDIYNWFLEKKRKILRWAIVAIIVCPLVIWGVYLIGQLFWGIPTDISADGILGYSAAIISSIATVFLGFITLALSKHANKINNALLDIQKDQFLLETRPFIMITHWMAFGQQQRMIEIDPDKIYIRIDKSKKGEKDVSCLSLFLTNTTRAFLLASLCGGSYKKNEVVHPFTLSTSKQYNTKLLLSPGETKELVLYGSSGFFSKLIGQDITFNFNLENHVAERYFEQVDVKMPMYSDPFERGIGEWYVMLSVQDYKVEKAPKE